MFDGQNTIENNDALFSLSSTTGTNGRLKQSSKIVFSSILGLNFHITAKIFYPKSSVTLILRQKRTLVNDSQERLSFQEYFFSFKNSTLVTVKNFPCVISSSFSWFSLLFHHKVAFSWSCLLIQSRICSGFKR